MLGQDATGCPAGKSWAERAHGAALWPSSALLTAACRLLACRPARLPPQPSASWHCTCTILLIMVGWSAGPACSSHFSLVAAPGWPGLRLLFSLSQVDKSEHKPGGNRHQQLSLLQPMHTFCPFSVFSCLFAQVGATEAANGSSVWSFVPSIALMFARAAGKK